MAKVMLSYIGILKNNFKFIRNEYKEIFSSKKHLYLSCDILNQNLSISKIYDPPALPALHKKSVSQNSLVKYSPICLECVKKILCK